MTADDRWKERGNCRDTDTDIMFPGQGESVREARAVCDGCTVKGVCLAYALDNRIRHGIWGGTTERDRIKLRAKRKLAPHGTRACYVRGCRQIECCDASDKHQRQQAWLRRQADYLKTAPTQ